MFGRIFGGDRFSSNSSGGCGDASAALLSDCYERPSRGGCGDSCSNETCGFQYRGCDCNEPYYSNRQVGGGYGMARGMGGMAPMMLSGFMNPYGGGCGGGGFSGGFARGFAGGFGGFGGGGFARGLLGGLFGGLFGGLISRIFNRFGGGGGGGGCDDGSCDDLDFDDGGSDWADNDMQTDERLEDERNREYDKRRRIDMQELDEQGRRRMYTDEERRRMDEERRRMDDGRNDSRDGDRSRVDPVVMNVRGVSEEDKARAGSMTGFEAESLRLINNYRRQNGLEPVEFDPRLQLIAVVHSKYQDQNGLGHNENRQGWATPRQRMNRVGLDGWAENSAYGSLQSPRQLVQMWIDSPGHRRALLDPNVKIAGISKIGKGATLDMV